MPQKEINNKNKPIGQQAPPKPKLDTMLSNIELDTTAKEPKEKLGENTTPIEIPVDKPAIGLAAKSAILHTYKEDVQDLVKNRNISMVRALAMQSDKKTQLDGDELVTISSKEPRDSGLTPRFLLISSILMVILGSTAIFIAYNAHQKQLSIEQERSGASAPIDTSLIFVEYRAKLDITDDSSSSILANLKNIRQQSDTTLGSITQVLLQDSGQTISQQRLVERLGLSLPKQFIRQMSGANDYMVGIHVADRNTPFILITTTSYEHAFASMLEWESVAERELRPFFNYSGNNSLRRTADNILIRNINARVMRDESSSIRLLYSFLDERALLITDNISTLTEVAQRYKVRSAARGNI